jgi:hypothetical protein
MSMPATLVLVPLDPFSHEVPRNLPQIMQWLLETLFREFPACVIHDLLS